MNQVRINNLMGSHMARGVQATTGADPRRTRLLPMGSTEATKLSNISLALPIPCTAYLDEVGDYVGRMNSAVLKRPLKGELDQPPADLLWMVYPHRDVMSILVSPTDTPLSFDNFIVAIGCHARNDIEDETDDGSVLRCAHNIES